MTYGILLIYYPKYYVRAIEEFECLMKTIDSKTRLIIVNNNESISNAGYESYDWIEGNNTNWDFSGWSSGLANIEELKDCDSVIFSNDTFCHHNRWGKFEILSSSLTFKYHRLMNVINPKSVMVGHRLFFGDDYSILGNTSNKWISTYLFFMTGKLINVFEKNICLNEDTLSNLVTIDSGELLWGDISTSLSNHIEEWMFPNDETKGWYGNNNNDSAMKLRKIKTILNEKFLSAKCNSVNGKTYDYDLFRVMKYLGRR